MRCFCTSVEIPYIFYARTEDRLCLKNAVQYLHRLHCVRQALASRFGFKISSSLFAAPPLLPLMVPNAQQSKGQRLAEERKSEGPQQALISLQQPAASSQPAAERERERERESSGSSTSKKRRSHPATSKGNSRGLLHCHREPTDQLALLHHSQDFSLSSSVLKQEVRRWL